jgi:hypothetical protein
MGRPSILGTPIPSSGKDYRPPGAPLPGELEQGRKAIPSRAARSARACSTVRATTPTCVGNEFCVLHPNFPELLARRRPWTT